MYTKQLTLRVDLDEETSKKFFELKKKKGLSHNTEVIRFLINEAHEVINNNLEVPVQEVPA